MVVGDFSENYAGDTIKYSKSGFMNPVEGPIPKSGYMDHFLKSWDMDPVEGPIPIDFAVLSFKSGKCLVLTAVGSGGNGGLLWTCEECDDSANSFGRLCAPYHVIQCACK